jgi:hypothetical protein
MDPKSRKQHVTKKDLEQLGEELGRFSERLLSFAEQLGKRGPDQTLYVMGKDGTEQFRGRLVGYLSNLQKALDMPISVYVENVADKGKASSKKPSKANRKKG